MVYAFDTLGYAQRLREAGVPQDQAEAHAAAARDFIMAELVTRTDLAATREHLQATFSHLEGTFGHLEATFGHLEAKLNQQIALLEQKIETQTLKLTVRLGLLMTAGIAVLVTFIKLA